MNKPEPEIVYSYDGESFGAYNLEDFEAGEIYYSGERVNIKAGSLVSPHFSSELLESMSESLWEESGDAAEGALSLSQEKQDELASIVKAFLDEHCSISCYRVINVKRHKAGHGSN